MVERAILEAAEAGRIPAEVELTYLDESRDLPAIAAIIAITALAVVAVSGRAFSRGILVKRFGFDDGLAALGLIHLVVFASLCTELIHLGSGRHYEYIQYVIPADLVDRTEVLDFVAHLVYTTALLICRFSGLAFYHRICGDHRKFAIAIKVTAGILFAGYIPQLCLIIFHCSPVTGLWPYDWQPQFDDFACLTWGVVYVTNSGVSLLCDFFLFGIPIAMIWMLEISRRRKLQLAAILMPGILVIGISITRLILVVKGQWESDMSWSYNPMLAVEVAEIAATLIALSVPGLKPFVDRFILGKQIAESTTKPSRVAGLSGSSDSTPMNSLQSSHDKANPQLFSNETLKKHIQSRYDIESGSPYSAEREARSAEGILIQVEFKVKEEQDYSFRL